MSHVRRFRSTPALRFGPCFFAFESGSNLLKSLSSVSRVLQHIRHFVSEHRREFTLVEKPNVSYLDRISRRLMGFTDVNAHDDGHGVKTTVAFGLRIDANDAVDGERIGAGFFFNFSTDPPFERFAPLERSARKRPEPRGALNE
jgi:hypothetical protein